MRRNRRVAATEGADLASTIPKRFNRDVTPAGAAGIPDEDLLEQFLSGEEFESQDAFRALVGRHGPSVLRIRPTVLDQDHDTEDAFQPAFLALARKGASIRDRRALAAWLREVTLRIAINARIRASRR